MSSVILSDVLWGSAIADAIGNPLEFIPLVSDGDFNASVNSRSLAISDDTQMSLFAYEALVANFDTRGAYLRWYDTQRLKTPSAGATGLLKFKSLYKSEAPGTTCLRSCSAMSSGKPVINDSKGNGTVMRVSPVAVVAYLRGLESESAYLLAKSDALQTHKHPFAWQSSVLLTAVYLNIFNGSPLPVAVMNAAQQLPSCSEVGGLMLSMFDKDQYRALRSRRCGWVAEEALALAIGANLHCTGYLNIVRDACQGVSCDSDTVAGIAGGIAAATGQPPPDRLKNKVAATDAIEYIINLYSTF